MNENIKKIAEHYGFYSQSHMMIEEMAELAQALIDHIYEEIADVEVCLEQIKLLLDCEANVKNWKDIKVARQVKRIDEENDRQKAERMAKRMRKLGKR